MNIKQKIKSLIVFVLMLMTVLVLVSSSYMSIFGITQFNYNDAFFVIMFIYWLLLLIDIINNKNIKQSDENKIEYKNK